MVTNLLSSIVYIIVTSLVFIKLSIIIYRKYKNLSDTKLILKTNGLVISLNLVGSYVTAIVVLGIPGYSYSYGLTWIWIAVIQISVAYTPILFLGSKLSDIKKKCKATSILDIIKYKYNSDIVVVFSAIIIIIFVFILMVSQIIGIRVVMSVINSSNSYAGFIWFVVLIIIYFMIAGVRSVDIFYTIEGAVVLVMSFLLVFFVIKSGGGLDTIKNKIEAINPQYFSPTGANAKVTFMYITSYWLCIGFALFGVPTISFRAALDKVFFKSVIIGSFIIITIILFNMNFASFLSIPLIHNVDNSDKVMPLIMVNHTSKYINWVFIVIVVMTSISAVNLQLNLIKTSLIYIFDKAYKVKKSTLKITSKILIFFIICFASIFAISYKSTLAYLSLYSTGGLVSSFIWMIFFIPFNFKFVNSTAAIFSIAFGLISYVLIYNLHLNWRELFFPVTLPVIVTFFIYIIFGYLHYIALKIYKNITK